MEHMSIKDEVIWYLKLCNGSISSVKRHMLGRADSNQIEAVVSNLVVEKRIQLITFEKMNLEQQKLFDIDPSDAFYRVINV